MKYIIDFSLNEDAFCRFYRIMRKQKNPAAKCYPQWELNPGPLTFMPCMLLSELIPYGSLWGIMSYYKYKSIDFFAIATIKNWDYSANRPSQSPITRKRDKLSLSNLIQKWSPSSPWNFFISRGRAREIIHPPWTHFLNNVTVLWLKDNLFLAPSLVRSHSVFWVFLCFDNTLNPLTLNFSIMSFENSHHITKLLSF